MTPRYLRSVGHERTLVLAREDEVRGRREARLELVPLFRPAPAERCVRPGDRPPARG